MSNQLTQRLSHACVIKLAALTANDAHSDSAARCAAHFSSKSAPARCAWTWARSEHPARTVHKTKYAMQSGSVAALAHRHACEEALQLLHALSLVLLFEPLGIDLERQGFAHVWPLIVARWQTATVSDATKRFRYQIFRCRRCRMLNCLVNIMPHASQIAMRRCGMPAQECPKAASRRRAVCSPRPTRCGWKRVRLLGTANVLCELRWAMASHTLTRLQDSEEGGRGAAACLQTANSMHIALATVVGLPIDSPAIAL